MGRLRRRISGVAESDGVALSLNQRSILLYGFDFNGERAFADSNEYKGAWRRHRNGLVFELGVFKRPEAYWLLECDRMPPDCAASGYVSERDALIRWGLPLSRAERAQLTDAERELYARTKTDGYGDGR